MKYILTLTMMMLPAMAWAAPEVKIAIIAEKVVMVEESGKKIEKLIPVEEVLPGDVLAYTLTYKNQGDETAVGVRLVDPIPKTTAYIVGSAFGPGSEVSFSIDHGEAFKSPSMLTYNVDIAGETVSRKASPEQYTDILWKVKSIPAGKGGVVGFRVRVK